MWFHPRIFEGALAKVMRAEVAKGGFKVLYTFETTSRVKGSPPEQFQILGYPAVWE